MLTLRIHWVNLGTVGFFCRYLKIMVVIHWFASPVHRVKQPLSLQYISFKNYVFTVSQIKRKIGATQEILRSILEWYSILGYAYPPSLNQTMWGKICAPLWNLLSLDLWYIWSHNICTSFATFIDAISYSICSYQEDNIPHHNILPGEMQP